MDMCVQSITVDADVVSSWQQRNVPSLLAKDYVGL